MEKEKDFRRTRFTEGVIREAAAALRSEVPLARSEVEHLEMTVEVDGAEWGYDSEEEFYADYRRSCDGAIFCLTRQAGALRLRAYPDHVRVRITAKSRPQVEAISAVFEQAASRCALPGPAPSPPVKPVRPTIFIGHGRSPVWRELKDHLHEKHGYTVVAYEIGARGGHAIRDVLEEMLARSSFALLVLTGEDETSDGRFRARQNVVHEVGLFQGRLGFKRAVVLFEEGTEEFSNLHGIEQIKFAKGSITGTYGDVLATIAREFPSTSV